MATLAHDQTTVNAKGRRKCTQVKNDHVQLHGPYGSPDTSLYLFPTRLFEGNDEVLANDDVTNLSWHLLSEERSLDYLGPAMAKRIRQTSKKFSQILMIHLNIYMFNYTRLILVCGILLTSMLSNNHAHPDLFLSIAESKFHQSYLLPRF